MRRNARTILQFIMTIILVAILLNNVSWISIVDTIQATDISFFVIAFFIFLIGHVIYAYKWLVVLKAGNNSANFKRTFQIYLIGIFFNNFFPTTMGGDWARVYYLGQDSKNYSQSGVSVLIDRFLGFFATTVIASILSLFIETSTHTTELLRLLLILIGFGLIIMFITIRFLPIDGWIYQLLGHHARIEKITTSVVRILQQIRQVSQNTRVVLIAFVLTGLFYILIALIYMYFLALFGKPASLIAVIFALATISILSNIPLTINGIGLREQLHILLLIPLGFTPEIAVTLSLLIFVYFLILSFFGLVSIWLFKRQTKSLVVQHPTGD